MNGDPLRLIADWLSAATRVVAFTGAGISTESGVPDFRSPGGVWSRRQPVYFDAFLRSAEARYEYWQQKAESQRDFSLARPNAGHETLARWERQGVLQAVITQNIDGLHPLAGSRRVLELHGTARLVSCLGCGVRFDAEPMVARFLADDRPPDCPHCGGLLKHATVSFGQPLPQELLDEAIRLSREAELFLAIGSSLVVHPAASLPPLAKRHGGRLVILNREPTPQDELADVVVRVSIGAALVQIDRLLASFCGEPGP